MRIALAAVLLLPFSSPAASLTGTVVDETGAYIAHAALDLDSGANKYQVHADDTGVYKFSNLSAGEYTLRVGSPGFKSRIVKPIRLTEREPNRLLDIPLDVGHEACGQPILLDRILLSPGETFGSLTGSVAPPRKGVEVTLICRTFTACKSTKTDFRGRFTFEMLSTGVYGLNYHRAGFYPDNATGYEYSVIAGWKSVYSSVRLEWCPHRNCDPKLRPPKQPVVCE
ncbi:MAG: carboxypeptidase-like regulatory domain-containing protein [Acidobacteriia bacterium]|nr:carboxypeptidase-like regulatory domain-containing protein [Terriglobia bacterium]